MGGHLGTVGHVFNLLAGDGAGRVDDADTKAASDLAVSNRAISLQSPLTCQRASGGRDAERGGRWLS